MVTKSPSSLTHYHGLWILGYLVILWVGRSSLAWLVRVITFASHPWPCVSLACLKTQPARRPASRGSLLTLDQRCGPLQLAQSMVCAISTRKQTGAQLTPLNLEYGPLVLFRRITNFKDHFKQKARPISRKQGQRQADLWELETNMVYIAHSRAAIHICEASQKEKKITVAGPCRKYNV